MCDKTTNYISIFTTQLSRLSKISRYLVNFTKCNCLICLMYKCSKNTVYCDKSISIKLCNNDDDYHDKVLCLLSGFYSKFANTAHDSCTFGIVYSNIQKFTIITIMKPITYLYLDMDLISIYLRR